MPSDPAPPEIEALAERRAAARRARDWPTADLLKAEIEAAGWRVVDAATLWSLERAAPPVVEEAGRLRYGASGAVPSRLDEAPVGVATVVIVDDGWASDVARAVGALAEHAPDGTQVVIVANGPAGAPPAELEALDRADPGAPGMATEVVWTAARLTPAAALNAGMRRAGAAVVVVLDPALEPRGDVVGPLVDALADPDVAVAGPFGLVSPDLRRFVAAPEDTVDVDAIDGSLVAFRRADFVERGPLDERFRLARPLDAWWSLVLRDEGPGEPARRALQVPGLELVRHAGRSGADRAPEELDRLARKDGYRLLKRFATRRDLLVGR